MSSLLLGIRVILKFVWTGLSAIEYRLQGIIALRIQRPDGPPPSSYFDTLSEECVSNVLHHLSERPRHKLWASHVKYANALCVLWSGGILERVWRKELASLGVFVDCFVHSFPELHSIHGNPLLLDSYRMYGQPLRDAIFTRTHYELRNVALSHNTWLHMNPEVLRGVRHLRIFDFDGRVALRDILKVCSGHVRTLDVEGRRLFQCDVDSIAETCSGLETLRLAFLSTTATDCTNLWKTVGPTLEHLILKIPVFGEDSFYLDEEISMNWASRTRKPQLCRNNRRSGPIGTYEGKWRHTEKYAAELRVQAKG